MIMFMFEAEHKLIKQYVTSSEYLYWTGEIYRTQSPVGDIFVKWTTKLYFVYFLLILLKI